MKGVEMTIVQLIILVFALAIFTIVVLKLLPSAGNFLTMAFKNLKTSMCKTIGIAC
jgi:hypothetical protein